MDKKQAKLRLQLIKQQLTIATLYEAEFIKQLGAEGVETFINERLEEISKLRKIINHEK